MEDSMKYPELDVATTATLRPELYRRCLDSFWKHLQAWPNWRLILHIDCVGDDDATPDDILAIAREKFEKIEVRISHTPSFPAAWKWCASQIQAPWVFWLEDDWEAILPFDVCDMYAILRENPGLCNLRLPRWWSGPDWCRQWNQREIKGWNGRFMLIGKENMRGCGFSGNPGFVKREFLAPVMESKLLDTMTFDIEKQFFGFNPPLGMWVQEWRSGIYQQPNSPPTIKDIGEQWRKDNNFAKGRDKVRFKTWVRE